MDIIQVAAVGLIAVLLALQFRSKNQEYGVYISLVTAIIIFFFAISKLEIILETINKIYNQTSINRIYFEILLKIVGIAYISEFASQLCKDAGYGAIATQVEIVGKLTILIVSLPILLSLIDTVNTFLI